jgi:hypothetical protein
MISNDSRPSTASKASFRKNRKKMVKKHKIEGHTSDLAIKFAAALKKKMEKMTGETFDGKRLKRKTETNLKGKASIKVQPRVTKAAT